MILITLIIIILTIVIGFYLWHQFTVKNLQESTKQLNEMNNLIPSSGNSQSPNVQGQLNSLRDSVNQLQQKKDAEIQEEMQK